MNNTVCLCGSTRFLDDFHTANVELTRRGISVITISMALPKNDGDEDPVKVLLDLVHFNKILRADTVLVVGNGYIGFSTAREILWAEMQGKPIFRQQGSNWDFTATLVKNGSFDFQVVAHAREVLGLPNVS